MDTNLMAEVGKLRERQKGKEGPVVSLYLNQSFNNDYQAELNSLIRKKEKVFREFEVPKERKKIALTLFDKLKDRVEQLGRPGDRRLLICFCGPDFWHEYQLPVSIPSKLIVEPEPYIRPFTTLSEQFDRYCLAVVDRKQATIATYYLGDFDEEEVVIASNVPGQVSEDDTGKAGGGSSLKQKGGTGREAWGGWREAKIQHHIDDHLQHYLSYLSRKLFRLVRKKGIHHLVLAGPKGDSGEILAAFKPHLHSELRQKVIGTFPGDSRLDDKELETRFRNTIGEFKGSRERKFLDRLIAESTRPSGLGVLGLEKTLKALYNAQVRILAVRETGDRAGWICPKDYYLSAEEGSCPKCNSELKITEDILGHMIWEAIDQGAEIRHIRGNHEEFADQEVGALLRFRLNH